jgi:hypothetical protein
MEEAPMSRGAANLTEQVVADFLVALSSARMADAVIEKLRNVLLVEKNPSEKALRDALFGELQDKATT